LTKVDLFDLNKKKLSETHKELSSEKFVENGNLPESNRDTLSIKNLEENQLQAESFTDGKIVKYYKIVIEKDEGLPYLIKDSLNIYNSRGVEGIPPPKIDLKEESIYYDGSRIYRSGLRKMKIVKTVYFKEPFSINRELYYCDGEKNFYKVINDKLQMSIHDKVESEISSDDFQIQKNEIDKNSEIYKELNGQVKEQGIYVLIKETTEDNVRTQRIRKFNLKKNDD